MANIKSIKYLTDLVPDEFKLNCAIWLGGEFLDESWLFLFGHKYPDMHKKFIAELNNILTKEKCLTSNP